MNKFIFIVSLFFVGAAFTMYSMEPAEPREGSRLFIRNNRSDAVLVTYGYDREGFRGVALQRVVYPEEVIWIGNPEQIATLKLSAHGEVMQYTSPETLTFGMIPGKDYALEVKGSISGQGGVEMTISGFIAMRYNVTVNPSSNNIVSMIPLIRCKWLGDIFTRAKIAFEKAQDIKPEYILGVPSKPTSGTKAIKDYETSVDEAHSNLQAAWADANYKSGAGLLDKKKLGELIGLAYSALRLGGQRIADFKKRARTLFEESQESFTKAACEIPVKAPAAPPKRI